MVGKTWTLVWHERQHNKTHHGSQRVYSDFQAECAANARTEL